MNNFIKGGRMSKDAAVHLIKLAIDIFSIPFNPISKLVEKEPNIV